MKPKAISFSLLLLAALLVLVLSDVFVYRSGPARAQTSSANQAPSIAPLPAAVPQAVFTPLWRTDGNFTSEIHIKNSLLTGPIQVTPVLYMADGTEYDLPSITLPTAGIATVDIKRALGSVPPSLAAHLSQYGSAALRYQYPWAGEVRGQMVVVNVPASLIFTEPLNGIDDSASPAPQGIETLWWRRDPGVTGFVSVANTTDSPIQASVQAMGALGTPGDLVTLQLGPHAAELLDLDRLTGGIPPAENQSGGLSVHYNGVDGAMMMLAGLENSSEGYSATLPPYPEPPAAGGAASLIRFGAAGMMIGYADPMMGFPSGTRFTPYAALRNLTSQVRTISPVVYYMQGASPMAVQLPGQVLQPNETRQLNLMGMLPASFRNFSGTVNLELSYNGQEGEVAMAAGSVDQSGTYVFETNPEGLGQTISREMPYWSAGAGGADTMISLWNAGGQAEDLLVLFYVAGGQRPYQLPVHLESHALYDIDAMQLAMSGQADANGTVIPMGSEGSAVIENAKGWNEKMETGLCAGVYNPATGTCGATCVSCDGVSSVQVTPNPATCPVSQTLQLTATAYYYNGYIQNVTNSSQWSSSNTSVATVNSTGMMTGAGAGSAYLMSSMPNVETTSKNCTCLGCPIGNRSGSSSATVGAYPVNFRQTSGYATSDGVLHFAYAWSSSTGNVADLSNCTVNEIVTYPGTASTYYWPLPPWAQGTPNPTAIGLNGTYGGSTDIHRTGVFAPPPYASASFTATQTYNYTCYSGALRGTLLGPLSIVRSVSGSGSGPFTYKGTKSGVSASCTVGVNCENQ